MSIHRVRLAFEGQFVQIPNEWMRDTRLSRKARGLLAEIMTHSEGWEITIDSLIEKGTEGRDAVRGAISELEKAGYLRRERRRDGGRYGGIDYILQEPPALEVQVPISSVGETYVGGTNVGETPLKNTITKEHNDSEHHGVGVGSVTPITRKAGRRKWSPSDAAWETATTEICHYLDREDLGLITARYELICHEKKRKCESAEWLKWVIEDEKKAKVAFLEKKRAGLKKEPWHAVAE